MHKPSHPTTCAILLAGGCGSRMCAEIPKQLLSVGEKPLARHSFEVFLEMTEIDEIMVVCAPEFRHLFDANTNKSILFAPPGQRRQDSTYNGLTHLQRSFEYICIHDAARPFISKELVIRVLDAAVKHGASAAGIPVKFTVKETTLNQFVQKTPDRSSLWEIQTPQIIRYDWLMQGFENAIAQDLTVTDDVSLVEIIGKPVKLVEGSHSNIKVTVPCDLTIANYLYDSLNVTTADVS